MIGDDATRSDHGQALFEELRAVRQSGLTRIRVADVPELLKAAQAVDDTPGLPVGESVRRLLQQVLDKLGDGQESTTAAQTLGVAPGTRMWSAADRRKAAARTQGVSVERFRHGYEPQLLQLVADEIAVLGLATTGTTTTVARDDGAAVVHEGVPLAPALAAANGRADWREVRGTFRQCVALAADPAISTIPERLLEGLGAAFDGLVPAYDGDEQEFLVHAMATLLDVDGADRITFERLGALYDDERFCRLATFDGSDGRAVRPTPFETCIETIRRLRDVRAVRDAVAPIVSSGVVGGSSSYSRFGRVRGVRDGRGGSDLDLVLIVEGAAQVTDAARRIAALPAVDRSAAAVLSDRGSTFATAGYDDGRTIFSQKVPLWSDVPDPTTTWRPEGSSAYVLDLRVMTLPVLSWLLLSDAARIEREITGNWRSIRDYCDRHGYTDDHQRSFSGRDIRFTVTSEDASGGVLRTTRAYVIDDSDRFYPGTLQNVVLPLADCRWDGLGATPVLRTFRTKIDRRVAYERRIVPHEVLLPSLAHTRSSTFTEAVLARIDR